MSSEIYNKLNISEAEWIFEGSSIDEPNFHKNDPEEASINLAEIENTSEENSNMFKFSSTNYYRFYENSRFPGYNVNGNRFFIEKKNNKIDYFLTSKSKVRSKHTIYDPLNNCQVLLTNAQTRIINRLKNRKMAGKFSLPPTQDIEIQETAFPSYTPKESFLPSKTTHNKILRIIKSVRNGWRSFTKLEREKKHLYDIWERKSDKKITKIFTPKILKPNHKESFNPSKEYLIGKGDDE